MIPNQTTQEIINQLNKLHNLVITQDKKLSDIIEDNFPGISYNDMLTLMRCYEKIVYEAIDSITHEASRR